VGGGVGQSLLGQLEDRPDVDGGRLQEFLAQRSAKLGDELVE
jgi:hypothetical protein